MRKAFGGILDSNWSHRGMNVSPFQPSHGYDAIYGGELRQTCMGIRVSVILVVPTVGDDGGATIYGGMVQTVLGETPLAACRIFVGYAVWMVH